MHDTNHAHHAHHDLTLIAGHAAGDLSDTDRVRADALISTCTPCADIRRDLVAIAAATRSLPAPAMPARDFRLVPEQAERLRRGSWLRAVLRPFSSSSSAVRPLAAAFTSLGLAGLLVASVFPSLLGSAAGALGSAAGAPVGAERDRAFEAARSSAAVPAPAATQGGVANQGAQPSDDRAIVDTATGKPVLVTSAGSSSNGPTGAPEVAVQPRGKTVATDAPRLDASGGNLDAVAPAVNPLIAGSLALLALGLLLFGLRFASRRLRN
jgi:hypothetical protein